MDLVNRAREFAINAHSKINHRRKYTKQPYASHLSAVAKLVGTVTDDEEIIAAAWLHDVVEDTSVTISDVESVFGKDISRLVDELTDRSKPADGVRAVRKRIDLVHLARASPRAQTVKLADLIDNSLDITNNDPRFAKIYLKEMADLLGVLTNGDKKLYEQARVTCERCLKKIDRTLQDKTEPEESAGFLFKRLENKSRLLKLIMKTFTAYDIAEPLRSFNADSNCKPVHDIMDELNLNMVGIRENGKVLGFVLCDDLTEGGICKEHLRQFHSGQIVQDDSSFGEVIHVLGLHNFAFVHAIGDISGYISRNEVNKPEFRMWLFGIITFIEMEITRIIKNEYSDNSWQSLVSEGRFQKAQQLQQERLRRGERCDLVDCLQYSDKGRILLNNDTLVSQIHLGSKSIAKQALNGLESLRNNLAHSQDIGNQNWDLIAKLSYVIEYDAALEGLK